MNNLVIVESPTKAKTISKFLDKEYNIKSSFGHIRDLPKSKMGIDIANNFEPEYIIPRDKSKTVNELKKLAAKADNIYFATDADREGEAISWHLAQIFKTPADKIKRITFHEITKSAVLEALENPRVLDINLVDAQQARRVLDRLVGYELSPLLWKKVAKGLSAGRVQSVAVRLIVDREREIKAFNQEEYWTIEADFQKNNQKKFTAKLHKLNGKILDKLAIHNKEEANEIKNELENFQYTVFTVEKKQFKRNPLPPYTTSTLQQDAIKKFGFSAKQTMVLAQQLYEGINLGTEGSQGLITYMRTDSVNLSDKFLIEAAVYIKERIGSEYLPAGARRFKTKSKNAQEAHEAIRPTEALREPESIRENLDERQFKLYRLIWQRAIASQMKEALIDNTIADIHDNTNKYSFRAAGQIINFLGFLKIYPTETKEKILPELVQGEIVNLEKLSPIQHFTEPPARYTEATLVKTLEEKGIGRPSTYAPTMATIMERNYVMKEDGKLKPTDIALVVNDLLVEHFPTVVDYDFTARMENNLDEIADGKMEWRPIIQQFYTPFKEAITVKEQELSKKNITETKTDEKCDKCGSPMVIKIGRFGRFIACSNYPECKNTKKINSSGEVVEDATPELLEEKCPECGNQLQRRQGRFGAFIGCSNYPKCKYIKKVNTLIGIKCPVCGTGDLVAKRGRGGKTFYACSEYPKCKKAFWSKPTGEKCPNCGELLVAGAKETIVCPNKECGHKK